MVPHLTTALTGPLLELERKFLESSPQIEHWLRGQWQEYSPPFYSSCDLRNSGFKLAPVDTNLFPGGFNNLNPAFLPLCVHAAMVAIEKICPDARNLLLIPENHTRNQFYLQNVAQIAAILRQTGLNVRLGSLLPEITKPTPIELPNGQSLLLEPLVRSQYRLGLDGFDPCAASCRRCDEPPSAPGQMPCKLKTRLEKTALHDSPLTLHRGFRRTPWSIRCAANAGWV